MPPQSRSQSQPHPASQVHQLIGRFAEAKIATPAPHVRSELRYRRFHADAFGPTRGVSDSVLKPLQSFWRDSVLQESSGFKFIAGVGQRTTVLGTVALRTECWGLQSTDANRPLHQLRLAGSSRVRQYQRPRLIGHGLGMAKLISSRPRMAMFFRKWVISPSFACGS